MKNTAILSTLFALCFWACSKTSPSEPDPLLWSQTLKSPIESVQLSGQWLFVSQELFATNMGSTVNYHKPFRSFDKSTGQTGLELSGVDNFYVHENQAALFYVVPNLGTDSKPSKIEIFDLDTRAVKATLATSPSVLVSDPFGGSHYEEPFFTGAGQFLFYADGPQFHLTAYDLQSGQMAPIAPDSFPSVFSLAAWEEPNGHVLYLKRHSGAPFSPNESAQLYDQTTGQLLASSNNDLGYFFSGQQAGELFFGTTSTKLAAIEKNGFQVRWEIAKKDNVHLESNMVIQTNGTAADSIFGYRASDGGLVWAAAKQQNFAIAAAGDGLVLLSHYTGGNEVVGINVQTGAEAFRLKTDFIQKIWAVSDGLFWASLGGNKLACYKYR